MTWRERRGIALDGDCLRSGNGGLVGDLWCCAYHRSTFPINRVPEQVPQEDPDVGRMV